MFDAPGGWGVVFQRMELFAQIIIAFSGIFLCSMICSVHDKLCEIAHHLRALRDMEPPPINPEGIAALFKPAKFGIFKRTGK